MNLFSWNGISSKRGYGAAFYKYFFQKIISNYFTKKVNSTLKKLTKSQEMIDYQTFFIFYTKYLVNHKKLKMH